MSQQTPKKQVLFPRTHRLKLGRVLCGVLALLTLATLVSVHLPQAHAATNSTLNFQARLQSASGGIAPDGTYNIDFKLYNHATNGAQAQGTCSSNCLWEETYYDSNGVTAGNDNRVTVRNGYLTVNLGSQTAFPGTINWDQDLWITMNVGGTTQTATPTWDGEMSPRLKLTATNYAFKAGQLATFNSGNNFTSTLSILQPTVGNQVFQIADQGAAGTYSILTNMSGVKLQSTIPGTAQTGNLNISGGAVAGTLTVANGGGIYSNAYYDTSGSVDRYLANGFAGQIYTDSNAMHFLIAGSGTAGASITWSEPFSINQASGFEGAALFKNKTNSNIGFVIQNAGGTPLLTMDTTGSGSLTVATATTINGNVTIGAGKYLALTGSGTRPGSPTLGMVYYDTTQERLLVYNGTTAKWQADRTDAILVAASNSTQADKDAADYVADGNTGAALDGDQVQIQLALNAASSAAKKVVLLAGTYTIDASISIPNNVVLAGVGSGTLITIPNSYNTTFDAITNTTTGGTGTGIVIRDLRMDGNKSNQTTGNMNAIHMDGVGSGTGATAIPGATITNVFAKNWRSQGFYIDASSYNILTGNTAEGNGGFNFYLNNSSTYNILNNNNSMGSDYSGFALINSSSKNTLTGNNAQGNLDHGFSLNVTSNYNTLTGNTATGNASSGFWLGTSSTNTLNGNTAQGNAAGFTFDTSHNNTVTGNIVVASTSYGINIFSSNTNTVTGNKLYDNGGTNFNNGIYIDISDSNMITGNSVTDSSASVANYAINVFNSTSDTNYLADNTLGGGTLNNAGTGTIFGGQLNSSGNYMIQPGGTIELMANSNVTGTLGVSSLATLSGGLTVTTGGNIAFQRNTTDITTTGGVEDYAGTGTLFRFAAASAQTLSSIANPANGRMVILINDAATALTIKNDACVTSCTATNRILTGTGADISLIQNATITLIYDSSDNRWRVVGGTAALGTAVSLQASTPGTQQTGHLNISGTAVVGTSVLSPAIDVPSAGTLSLGTSTATAISIGTSTATATVNGNLVVATGKYLTLTGSGTRPGSPTDGMMYYDTTQKRLLVYNVTKAAWQADRTDAILVAASNSSQTDKDAADYIGDGNTAAAGDGDQVEINAALTAASGKKVVLLAGTYTVDASISVPNNTTLQGVGKGTIVTVPNSFNAAINTITNTDQSTGTSVTVRDMTLDGNSTNQTSGTMRGIYFNVMGANSGTTTVAGAKVTGMWITSFRTAGMTLQQTLHSTITNNTITNITTSGEAAIDLVLNSVCSNYNVVSNNDILGGVSGGIGILNYCNYNTINNNVVQGITSGTGIVLGYIFGAVAAYNTVSGNTLVSNGNGIDAQGPSNSITGNTLTSNTGDGIVINHAAGQANYNSVSGNNITSNANAGIEIGGGSTGTVINGNTFRDNGGATNNYAVLLTNTNANTQVTNNVIYDSSASSTNVAINISGLTDKAFISSNLLYDGSVVSNGTFTIAYFVNQRDVNGTILTTSSTSLFNTGTAAGTVTVQGGYVGTQTATPAQPGLTNIGTAGSTSYTYAITAADGSGETALSTVSTTATGNATLNGTNYNQLSWTPVKGVYQYKVYRTASGSGTTPTTGLIGTVSGLTTLTTLTFNDTGLVATGNIPTANTTGGALFAGAVQAGSLQSVGLNIQNAAGTSVVGVNNGTPNLIRDPSFETGNTTGWTARGSATFVVDDIVPNFGLYHLALTTNSAANNGIQYNIGLQPSTTYTFSFFVRKDSGSAAAFNVGRAENGTDNDCANITNQTIGTTVLQLSCTFTTGATIGATPNVYIKQTDTASDLLYIDGVTLVTGSTARIYTTGMEGSTLQVESSTGNVAINLANNPGLQAWKTSTNTLTAARDRYAAVSYNGYLYIMGGGTASDGGTPQNTVYYTKVNADGSINGWNSTSTLGTAVSGADATVVNGYVYVIGGSTAGGSTGYTTGLATTQYARINTDGTLGAWTTTTAIPQQRYTLGVTSANGYIYAMGGINTAGTYQSTIYYAKVNADGTITSWSSNATTLSSARAKFQPFMANGKMYMLGGETAVSNQSSTVEYFTINKDGSLTTRVVSPTSFDSMPSILGDLGGFALNGNIYAVGGWNGAFSRNIYSAATNSNGTPIDWQTSTAPLPNGRENFRALVANGYVYVIGGEASSIMNSVYYTSTARTQIGGSLDLVGISGGTLSDGNTGGSLTAGNTLIVGTVQVQDVATFNNNTTINGTLSVNAPATFRNMADSTTAFQIQNNSGTTLLNSDTTSMKLTVGGTLEVSKRTDSGGSTSDWATSVSTAGTVCSQASVDTATTSVVYNGSLYVGTSEADKAELCRYNGGTSWTLINSASGTFGSNANTDKIGAMAVFNGYLYIGTTGGAAGTGADANTATMYRWDGSTTFTKINNTQGSFNVWTNVDQITSMTVFQSHLYFGVGESGGAAVFQYDSGSGASAIFEYLNTTAGQFEANTGIDAVSVLTVYRDHLYAGLNKTNGAVVVQWGNGLGFDSWFTWQGPGQFLSEGNIEDEVTAMVVHNDQLVIAVSDGTAARILMKNTGQFNDTSMFTTAGTFGSQTNVDRITSLAVYNGELYIGTQESGAAGVYVWDGEITYALTNTAAGQFVTTTAIDGVTTMQVFDNKLFIGTNESNSAQVYNYSKSEGQSNAIRFYASSDNAGSTEQAAFPNYGQIFFQAEKTANYLQNGTGSFIFSHGITTATGAYDIAEDYPTRDDSLEPGDLVSLDAGEKGFVKRASGQYDSKVVGVYSEKPGLRLSQADSTIDGAKAVPVALAGRVPVKVSTENGPVLPGDPLTASSVAGVAMRATEHGRIVGMAMEGYNSEGVGKITAFINPNYFYGAADLQGDVLDVAQNARIGGDISVGGGLSVSGQTTLASLTVAGDANILGTLTVATAMFTGNITVNGHIVSGGLIPTIVAGEAACMNPIATIAGTDTAGLITIASGMNCTLAGKLATVTFNTPFGSAPRVTLTPGSSNAVGVGGYVDSDTISPTSFDLGATSSPLSQATYKWYYQVIQ